MMSPCKEGSSLVQTRRQLYAQLAFQRVTAQMTQQEFEEYTRFAKKFPALIQACGLVQSIAFAQSKRQAPYLMDLAFVMGIEGTDLYKKSREADLLEYQYLTRQALECSSWLKRYTEALSKE